MSIRRHLAALLPVALIVLVGSSALADCDGGKPILYLTFASETLAADQISDFADRVVRGYLRQLPGVADVALYGDRHPVMRIRLDRSRLSAFGLAPHDVEQTLRHQDIQFSSDGSDPATIELPISVSSSRSPGDIGEIVLAKDGDAAVRLTDVASLELAPGVAHAVASYHGREVVALGVINQPNSALAVWFAMRQALANIRPTLPPDMQVELASPFSIFIDRRGGG
jgi:multidrug efflux pump